MSDITHLKERILSVPLVHGRRIVAISGAPASGKSTLSAILAEEIPNACVVPMDGFHRSNDDLERHGLLSRKGAPQTFDVTGFLDVVRALNGEGEVGFPTFDRNLDCVIENGGVVRKSDTTVLVEGNYLLLKLPPWSEGNLMWALSIFIHVPRSILKKRLIERWQKHGHSPEEAENRVVQNDMRNANLIVENRFPADLIVNEEWITL